MNLERLPQENKDLGRLLDPGPSNGRPDDSLGYLPFVHADWIPLPIDDHNGRHVPDAGRSEQVRVPLVYHFPYRLVRARSKDGFAYRFARVAVR